jgi:hypothetical protein
MGIRRRILRLRVGRLVVFEVEKGGLALVGDFYFRFL